VIRKSKVNFSTPSQQQLNRLLKYYQTKQYNDAEKLATSITQEFPDHQFAWKVLAIVLKQTDKISQSLVASQRSVQLEPQDSQAHYNLAVILQELRRFDEAEASYREAIEFKPDYAEAHNNLDILLREKKLLMNISQEKKSDDHNKIRNLDSGSRLISNPFISNRVVETNLISNLYKIRLKQIDKKKGPNTKGPLFGNGKTTDFRFFENNQNILKNVVDDLSEIMRQAVKSEIYIFDSFLNIFNNGSGSIPHTHTFSFDKINNLIDQKFSLQYYLSVGDQTCSEPGIFKLNNPDEEILPSNGMVMIIPANRYHSAVYNGKIDRVMIGVNFYSLL
jgi:tetratricopeptide (TPR) repeat protein